MRSQRGEKVVRSLLCAAGLLTVQFPATAQQSAFLALRDSLAGSSDTTALKSLLRKPPRSREARDDELSPELRAGLIGLRLAELQPSHDFRKAISSFRRASKVESRRAEPWFALGLVEAARSEWEMRDKLRLGSRVGLGALERSGANYARALEANAGFVPAALALAQIELALLDTARLRAARDALRRVAAVVTPGPIELWLALGRIERAAGTLDSALVAFERYLAGGGHRALGLLELARTRLALGRADGEAPYYEGAALDDPVAIAEYRTDLELLAGDSVTTEFDRLTGLARAAYLHRFWTDRDRFELRPEGDRLREHYRRVLFARAHFALTISRRFYGRLDAYRSGSTELDDRGIMYIRHGEPAKRLRPFVFGAMPNESWRYARAEGDLLLHFSAGYDGNGGGDLYDYRLVRSVLDLRGAADAPRDQLILSRQSLSPLYSRILNWGGYGAAKALAVERDIGHASIVQATTTDSYELQFAHPLAAVADLIAVGRRGRDGLAHFVFGIAAEGASFQRVTDGVAYSVRVRLVALDSRNRSVAALDTIFVIAHPRPLTAREYLVGRAELIVPSGRWSYRAALQQGDSAGVVLPRGSVDVASADGMSPSLSDIALGTRGRAAVWVTEAGDTVQLAPSTLFRRGAEIEIYYEVTGAVPHARYRHEISVLRPDGRESIERKRPLVSLAFEEAAAGEVIRSRRRVQLERLKSGSYIVEVRVMGPDGSSEVRRRLIRLVD